MAKKTNHSTRKHALLSASGATRWMNCTPSARLEDKFLESKGNKEPDSPYAKEGTLAHEFGDVRLRLLNGEIDDKVAQQEFIKLRANEFYTDEMEEEVDKYVTYVWETLLSSQRTTPGAELIIEKRFDFSHIVENGFGTGDATIISDCVMDVQDLKYGKGIKVDADNNPQLMLYGLGALREFDLSYEIHTVRLTVVQPRLDHISAWDISVADLEEWGEKQVKPKAKKAYKGEGKKHAGEWCKWCKVKAMCDTLAEENIKLAQHDFKDAHLLTEKQILAVYKQIPMLTDWAKSVEKYVLDEAVKGKSWPGYKVVEGRSIRKWTDEDKIKELLKEEGFTEEEYLKMSLEGIGKIEKLLGKVDFKEKLNPFVNKPQGKPTLTSQNDKRPAMGIEQAKEDFKEK
jgi:hypothetical protein